MLWLFQWWAWAAAGVVLAILEAVLPASIFLGFAIGAGVVALVLGVGGAAFLGGSVAWLLVLFAAVSLIAWIGLRYAFRLKRGDVKVWTTDIND